MTFDLERARGLRDFLQDDCAEVGDVWGEMIAEIERLRASLIDLHAEYINTLEKNPECSAWDLDEQSDADQRRLRRNAAHAISIVEPPIYLKAEQQLAKIKELETAYLKAQNSNLLRKQEIERLRPFEIAARDLDSDLGKIAGERDDQAARIKELEADLEQAERVIEARSEVIDQQAARIQELGGMLSIRTEELEIAHSCARSEREMHEKELVVFARKIAELEDALVEGLTNFLHYRASCYDPARRCPYAKECDDCSTWDACGHVEKFRSEARRQLQAEGKIGPDAKPRVWQITGERKAVLGQCIFELEDSTSDRPFFSEEIAVLRAMLTEAGQE